jgi:AcrR family transcriptional regulator
VTTETVDGRTARRDRNREAVLDAVLELFAEDQLAPNAADVAARSGVSLRSVYRYYEDIDELVRAAMARHLERIEPLLEIPELGEGAFDDRVHRMVEYRMRLYEAVAPTMRAALVRTPINPVLGERIAWSRELLQNQAEAMFRPELSKLPAAERRAVSAALDTLLQFESAEHLRVTRGYSPALTSDILRRSITALFT